MRVGERWKGGSSRAPALVALVHYLRAQGQLLGTLLDKHFAMPGHTCFSFLKSCYVCRIGLRAVPHLGDHPFQGV